MLIAPDQDSGNKIKGLMPSWLIYIFLWLFFLAIPLITNTYQSGGDFKRVYFDWLRLAPFLVVFLVNSLVLLPFVLFRGYPRIYLLSILVAVSVISGIFYEISPSLLKNDPELIEKRMLQDPQYGREDMRPGPPEIPGSTQIFTSPEEHETADAGLFQFINTFLISLLIAGFNTAIAMTNKWMAEEQARKEAEKEHIRSELAFLQNQISPHFFMNTLNNIHALVESDQELAQNAVLKLSELMRYLLYESGRGTTTLRKEIEFLRSYVSLFQLRVDSSVKVVLELPGEFIDASIPPLLFISFVENAFKHGVSYRGGSKLLFRLVRKTDSIEFTSINSIPEHPPEKSLLKGGIGLENITRRLNLLYRGRHVLKISEEDNEYIVRLVIPV